MTLEQFLAIVAGILAAFELVQSVSATRKIEPLAVIALAVLLLAIVVAFDL